MKRVLVNISNSDLNKKFIAFSSKLQGCDFFFISAIENFIDELELIKPDVLIVGDKEYETIANNKFNHSLVNSINKFILAGHDLKKVLIPSGLDPIILQSDFNFDDFKQLIVPAQGFTIQDLNQNKPLKWIFDNLTVGLFWKDLNLRYLGCNKVFADDHGISEIDAVIGLSDYDLSPKHLADIYVQKDLELINSNGSATFSEETSAGQKGSNKVLHKRKILIRDDNGKVVGIMGMYEKISDEQLEEKLRSERRYMQMLIDNIPDTIYFKDKESRFININKAQAKILGIKNPDDAVGKTDADFFDKNHSLAAYNDEQEMMRTGIPVLSKLEHIKTSSGYRYVTATKIPLKDEQGVIIGMGGVSRDITQSHNLEMKLQQETNLLNSLLDSVPDSVYFKDRKSQFVRVSKSFLNKHNISNVDDIIGKTDADVFSSNFASQTFHEEQLMMETGEPLIDKLQSKIDAKGRQRFDIANKVPISDSNNSVVGMFGISRDITELKNIELKLNKEKELLQTLMDNIPDTIYFKDASSKFTRVNMAQARSLGLNSPEEAIGKSDFDFFDEKHASIAFKDEQEMMNIGIPIINKLEHFKTNGEYRYVTATKIPLKDSNGVLLGMVGISHEITDLKKTELELNKEKELLQTLMDNIPDTIYFKDAESKFTRVNMAQAICLGLESPDEAIGKSDFDFFDHRHASTAFKDEQEMMNIGTPILNKLEHIITPEGFRYVTATKIPLKDDQGVLLGMVGISHEITDLKNTELKLNKEKELLQTLMDNIPDTIYFKDAESKFTRVNMAQAICLGLKSPEEAIGKSDFDFFDPLHASNAFKDEQEMMNIGTPILNKLEHIKTPEGFRYVTATKIPLKDDDGKLLGMVGISHEITDLKNTELKLNKEKELLQSLMDNLPDTIYFKDAESRFTRINQAQAVMLGLQSPDEAIGKSDFDFSPKEQATLSFQDELDIMETGKPLINRVEKVHRTDGSVIWVSTTKIPVKDQLGNISGTVGMSRDITVLEEARNSLVYAKEKSDEANKAKSLFLANMSHEIRTPMNGVIGMSDVLNQTSLNDEQREYLSIITKSGNNLLSIINNILDFSKIESGSLELEQAPINIRQVIENVADVLITSASNKGVDLMNYVDSSIPEMVEGDSVRLSQVLINLVNNALKFTEHGEVYFTAELTESTEITFKVLFKVKDNGIGISKEAQEKIFHSFTQVDSSTTRKYGGTGLGLAISKRLVEMMGGEIGVESVEGEGSLFWFTAKFGVSHEVKAVKLPTKMLIDGLKVLIVDDNRTNRFVFGKYLEIWNCRYDQAENGEIALKMLTENAERNSPYDVALIDYQMEKMDGLKLAEQIQKNPRISSTRLILLSSVTDVIPRSEVARRGFNYFLNKPVKLKELYDVISSVTGNSEGEKIKQAVNADDFKPNLSVLVVEDNPTNLKVAQLILKPFVTAFDSAENGLIAFEKFKANKYDVIFMDIQMPVMNGYEATKSIRDYEAENNLTPMKIVAMTANAMKEDVEQCLSSGMDEYLSKPFRRDDMFKIIEKLNLQQKRSEAVVN